MIKTDDIEKDYSKNESVSQIMDTKIFTDISSRGLIGVCKLSEVLFFLELVATEKGHKINRLNDFIEIKEKLIRYMKEN